ncbi:hypothetical protein [Myxosarcina sp. GI1]|uniref:hypothetical protein n=1 Tax=Myxosarcina sp. GI1 TaxID=1541065 RepID=UPI0012E052FC|nr:hypothetical protein [Myxosarcina sp. GI1]
MKIILQTEARNISDREIAENQAYLIGLLDRAAGLTGNLRAKFTNNNKAIATRKTRIN